MSLPSTNNSSASSTQQQSTNIAETFQTATAQAAASLLPSMKNAKKLSNIFNYGQHQCSNDSITTTSTTTTGTGAGTCFIKRKTTTTTTVSSSNNGSNSAASVTSGSNLRTASVRLRLRGKTKKKLDDKSCSSLPSSSSAAAAAAACFSDIVQETITTTTFSKIHDQMAAIADPTLTMELLGASLNMNQSHQSLTEQFQQHPSSSTIHGHTHHHHHHHHTLASNANPSHNTDNQSATKTRKDSLNCLQQQQQQQQQQKQSPLTMKMKKLSVPGASNIQINKKQSMEDCCTKQDDCNCRACIQRQKIAEELIAEEESSKKKKQKKKKNKSSKKAKDEQQTKKDDEKIEESSMLQEPALSNENLIKASNEQTTNEVEKSTVQLNQNNSQTDLQTTDDNDSKSVNKQQTSKSNQSKKNKKNKSNQQSTSNQASSDPSKTSGQISAKESKEKSSGAINSPSDINDPTSIDIQQWIKVKNKNKQQQQSTNSNSNDWIVNDNDLNIENDNVFDNNGNNGNNHDQKDVSTHKGDGFKVILNDKSKKSQQNDDNSLGQSNDDNPSSNTNTIVSGLAGLRISGLSLAAAQSKAKLLAIEAQIAHTNNELKGAVQYISEAIEIDPKNPIYYINRAYYHERLQEYEHAIRDTETALRLDECNEYIEHTLCLKSRCLIGMNEYEQAEKLLLYLKQLILNKSNSNNNQKQTINQQPIPQKFSPLLDKDLLLLRMKKLVSCSYTIQLSRIYATKYSTIKKSLDAIEKNCQLLLDKKLNESDPRLHLWLINLQQQQHQQQQQQNLKNESNFIDEISKQLQQFDQQSNELKYWTEESQKFNEIKPHDFNDDDELYLSDDDEYEQLYGNTDKWNEPKDILRKIPVNYIDAKEPPNSKGQKALWIGNVSPSCSLTFVTNLFMKFGNVTFCKIFSNEQRCTSDVAYLLLHYDNDVSPRLVMSYFKDKIVPGISKDDNCPLLIRFRNKNDKIDDSTTATSTTNDSINSSSQSTILSSTNNTTSNASAITSAPATTLSSINGSNSPSAKTSECYYYRTTGCDRQHCTFRHVIGNKGIDRQTWMRKKN